MTATPSSHLPKPAWLDKDPSEWPPEARTLYTILGNVAERRLCKMKAELDQKEDGSQPGAAVG